MRILEGLKGEGQTHQRLRVPLRLASRRASFRWGGHSGLNFAGALGDRFRVHVPERLASREDCAADWPLGGLGMAGGDHRPVSRRSIDLRLVDRSFQLAACTLSAAQWCAVAMIRRAFPLLVLCVVGGCAEPQSASVPYYSPPVDTRLPLATLSKQLEPGMTEAQVSALREPDRVSLETCGQNSRGGAWQCRIYHYGFTMMVLFRATPSGWVVNSWT